MYYLICFNQLILESKWDLTTREVVKKVISIIKENNPGSYSILSSEEDGLIIFFDWSFDDELKEPYYLNGNYDDESDTIQIVLNINRKFYPQSLYDILADLNDIFRHEFEHHLQSISLIDIEDIDKKNKVGYKYYLQSHEIPAEIQGFRRISKLRKQPIETVIKDWFIRNKEINNLNPEELDIIVNNLVDAYYKHFPKSK